MTDHIAIETHPDGVVLVRMNRPDKKNALTGAMYDTMRGVIETATAKGVRAVVFAGHAGAFSAGNDLADFIANNRRPDGGSPAFDFIQALATVEVPMIAAVDGLAIGIGTTMVLHMDLAYATPRALFRMPFVDLGLVPEAASSLLVPERVGMKKAVEFLMLCESFDGAEAERLAVVNACVGSEEVEARALAAAAKLAAKPPTALAITRRLLRGEAARYRERMHQEMVHFAAQLKSDEARSAFMAFMARK